MNRLLLKIQRAYVSELPIVRLYCILYLVGVIVGVGTAILMQGDFSAQAHLLFSPENACGFWSAFLQQLVFFFLLFFLGLTVVGIPLLPLYPLYKGFSIGLLISLAVILTGVRGLIFASLAFFFQNALYTFLGYFVCYSSARLSVSLFELLKGLGKNGASYRELMRHIRCMIFVAPFLSLGALWEWKVVPLLLHLF